MHAPIGSEEEESECNQAIARLELVGVHARTRIEPGWNKDRTRLGPGPEHSKGQQRDRDTVIWFSVSLSGSNPLSLHFCEV